MPSSSDAYVGRSHGKKQKNKASQRRSRSKRSRKKHDSEYRSSTSEPVMPRMSLATYKRSQRPMNSEDYRMNDLCQQLGLRGGEYRDGHYVRYIEVPSDRKPQVVYEDRITYVEVPEVEYVTKEVDDVRVEEVIKEVPRKVEVPKEFIRHVPKIKTVKRNIDVPVPGKVVYNPIHYEVPRMIPNPQFYDQDQPVVVAQVLKPQISVNKGKSVLVEAYTIDPVLYPVDVFIPFPVQSMLKATHIGPTEHSPVNIPDAHYNTLVNKLNDTVPDDYRANLFKTKKGKKGHTYVPLLPPEQAVQVVDPVTIHGSVGW